MPPSQALIRELLEHTLLKALSTLEAAQTVRADMGTENVVLKDIQQYLRRNDNDDRAGPSSYITGASTANQRIKSWWGIMRKEGIKQWTQLRGALKDGGLFSHDFFGQSSFTGLLHVNHSGAVTNCTINLEIFTMQNNDKQSKFACNCSAIKIAVDLYKSLTSFLQVSMLIIY